MRTAPQCGDALAKAGQARSRSSQATAARDIRSADAETRWGSDGSGLAVTVSELDRWRVAQQLITAHGDKAEYQAGVRAAEFVKNGDLEGFYLWQNIALRVHQLQHNGLPQI